MLQRSGRSKIFFSLAWLILHAYSTCPGDSSGTLTKNSYAFCCPFGTDGSGYDGDGVTPIQSALAIKEYIPDADTLMLDDVGHFCWSDVFGGETVAPGELVTQVLQ